MSGITAQEIMNAALSLEEGQSIVTRCGSFEEMESLRKHLYSVRKTLLRTHKTLAYTLWISREIKDEGHFVIVAKELTVSNVIVTSKNGTVQPFTRTEASIGDESELERIKRLMAEDGMSEEEIQDALAKQGEEAFDEAAEKVEAAQAILAEKGKKKKGGKKGGNRR